MKKVLLTFAMATAFFGCSADGLYHGGQDVDWSKDHESSDAQSCVFPAGVVDVDEICVEIGVANTDYSITKTDCREYGGEVVNRACEE